jgi:hypothetical protein
MRIKIEGGWFDEDGHAYYSDSGTRIPSLTQVLRLSGLTDYDGIDPDVLENAARRGTEVHVLAATYNQYGALDPAWITEECAPYFDAYRRFLDESGFKPDPAWVEKAMIVKIHGMALGCTPDLFGKLGRDQAVIELKATSAVHSGWSVQTALQELAIFRSSNVGRVRRFALQLFNDTKYRLHSHTDHETDEAVGIAALRTVWWRIRDGQKIWQKLEAFEDVGIRA